MWDLIVSVPDHCLFSYFTAYPVYVQTLEMSHFVSSHEFMQ